MLNTLLHVKVRISSLIWAFLWESYCFGCLRSRTERQLWLNMTNEERRDVLRLIVGRKQRIEQMRLLKGQQLGFDFGEVVEVG